MTLFTISVNIKHFFVRLNSAGFKIFICENRKLPILYLKHPLFQHLHKNPKWTAMQIAKWSTLLNTHWAATYFTHVHSSMKTIAWIPFNLSKTKYPFWMYPYKLWFHCPLTIQKSVYQKSQNRLFLIKKIYHKKSTQGNRIAVAPFFRVRLKQMYMWR